MRARRMKTRSPLYPVINIYIYDWQVIPNHSDEIVNLVQLSQPRNCRYCVFWSEPWCLLHMVGVAIHRAELLLEIDTRSVAASSGCLWLIVITGSVTSACSTQQFCSFTTRGSRTARFRLKLMSLCSINMDYSLTQFFSWRKWLLLLLLLLLLLSWKWNII